MRAQISCAILVVLALGAGQGAAALDRVDVRVRGGDAELQALLARASATQELLDGAEDGAAPTAAEIVSIARTEYRQMLGALYSEGYYGGSVSVLVDGREAADISLVSPPARVDTFVIEIEPGPQFRFGEARIAPLAPSTALPEAYARGEIARSGPIREAARAGIAGWRDAGHAKAALAEERIVARHPEAILTSELRLAPGPQLRFGPLVITGNNRVRSDRIRAIAGLPEGELYSPAELDRAAERLRRTGAFRAVTLEDSEEIGPNGTLPIEATIDEEKRRRLGAGVEVSSTEGFGVTAFWMHRNLFGGAENLRFDLDMSNIAAPDEDNGEDYIFTGTFRRPATPFTDVDTVFFGELAREDEPGYLSESVTFGAGIVYFLSDRLEVSTSLAYRASQVEDAFGERDFQLLGFPSYAVYDTRDNELDATRGVFIRADVTPFIGLVDIDNGAHIEADARAYFGFGEDRDIVAAGRIQIGSLVGPEIDDAPPDFLFFAGGGGSVRGQPFQALGTGEVDGRIVGGRSYVALSAELRAYVRGPLGLVGFVDAGYIGEEELYDGSGEWISGAGLGLRYDTGFGPIRVDLATPVDGGPDDADPVQIYIGIGQAF
ncbi:MAG: autotransporter assembly complex family protein [Pseudomonadota bacterium]